MTTERILLGEDLGMGANKLYGAAGGLETLSQVAVNGSQRLKNVVGLKQRRRPLTIQTEHGSFYVGEGAHDYGRPVENLDFNRLTGAPEMKALLYGALTHYQKAHGAFTTPISMMVGLPLQMMSGENARAYANGVRGWLQGVHHWQVKDQTYQAEITAVKLTPQPVGALFDHVLDEHGRFISDRSRLLKQEIGILSVGFNTLELLVVRDRVPVERFTSGQTVGVRRLLELVNPNETYSLGELDTALRSNRLDLSAALPVWAREVNGEIEKRWGSAFRRFSRVLVVGGGAVLLKKHLTQQFAGNAVVPDQPVLSIARGLYKLALLKQ